MAGSAAPIQRTHRLRASAATLGAVARPLRPAGAGGVLLLVVALAALTIGAADIPAGTVLKMLLDKLPFVDTGTVVPDTWDRIVFEIRLPRIAAAAAVGAALAYSGAAYQGVFRNPLAGPFLLGIASGAGLGAAIAIVSPLAINSYGFGWVPVFAFVGALIAVSLAYFLARSGSGGGVSTTTLILAGVALSAIFSAITSFILLSGGEQTRPIFSFLFGGFNTANWPRILAGLPYLVVGGLGVALHARVLNVLQLDDEQAAQLGVSVTRTKLIILASASLVAATAVAMAGIIGFVGLIVPHAVRLVFGVDYRRLLLVSIFGGASFVILADIISRTLIDPQEIPVGIVTAIVGGPFFLYLLASRRVDHA